MRHLIPVLVCGVLFLASEANAQSAPASSASSGLDLTAIDRSANPCQNFYKYACGAWMQHNPIPADEASWGRFEELEERNQTALRTILEDSTAHLDRSGTDQKIGAFYGSCMNEGLIESKGKAPLAQELARIAAIRNEADLVNEVVELQRDQVPVLFQFGSMPDPMNAKNNIADLDQGGLGLPERDYYFRTDPKSVEIRQKYVAHIARMFVLAGTPQADATKQANDVMAFESALAKASLDVTSRRDPQRLIHKTQVSQLTQWSPNFDFQKFFVGTQTPAFDTLNVDVPDFVKALNSQLQTTNLETVKLYLAWQYLRGSARLLSQAFVNERFDFYSKTLEGVAEVRPRWKRCVSATDSELGEALGRKFVEKTFGEQGKQRTLRLVNDIEMEMAKDINSTTWMTSQTKQQALVKLHAVADKIGYPDKWRDYSSVTVTPDDYFGNWYRANQFESKRELDKIGKPVDRTEWLMSPPTVNAYYDPTQNNINFPAGILQPPFYSNSASDAVNYGAIGVVIGHELTHGFDDEGRQFDADGNLKNWWQKDDEERFTKLTECLVKEYGSFTPVPGLNVNGKLTLGENTADNGGIRLAYAALMDDLARRTVPAPSKVDGYTSAQQFYLGFAQVWCENDRPEFLRTLTQTNPHAPPEFRVNGVVTNNPEFDAAFSCKAGDPMYTASGCRVW